MSTATAALMIEGGIQISANQTWNIANASTAGAPFAGNARQLNNNEDFAINGGNTTGAGIPLNLGGFTVTTTGAGPSQSAQVTRSAMAHLMSATADSRFKAVPAS
jgi:hypothetical protein